MFVPGRFRWYDCFFQFLFRNVGAFHKNTEIHILYILVQTKSITNIKALNERDYACTGIVQNLS